MVITIKQYASCKRDFQQYEKMIVLLWRYHNNNYSDTKFEQGFRYRRYHCDDKIWLENECRMKNYVVKIRNKYIRAFSLDNDYGWAHIKYLYICPQCRNNGMAKIILDYIFKTTGTTKITLIVWDGNIKAKEAYRHIGFEFNGTNQILLRKRVFYEKNKEIKYEE